MFSRSASSIRWPRAFNSCKPNNFPGSSTPCRSAAVAFSVRRLLRTSFPFPLPPFLAVKGFREDVLATSLDINSHLARARREVSAVHFKRRIGDVKIELDRLDRFDSGTTTHCFGVTLNHFVNRGWRAATSKRRRCEYGCPDQLHQAALPIHDY